jgi:hypothetical protein
MASLRIESLSLLCAIMLKRGYKPNVLVVIMTVSHLPFTISILKACSSYRSMKSKQRKLRVAFSSSRVES